jgi:hypothetical protein
MKFWSPRRPARALQRLMRTAAPPLATQAPPPKRRGGDGPSAVGARGVRAAARPLQPDAPPQPVHAPPQPASLHELLLAALLSGAGGAALPQPPPQPQPLAPARRHAAPAHDSESDDTAPSKPGAQPAPKRRLTDQQARGRGPLAPPRRHLACSGTARPACTEPAPCWPQRRVARSVCRAACPRPHGRHEAARAA